jgi:transcriptional regulator with XRE-family HTH domain
MARNQSVFAKRLREARMKAGLSQKKLGIKAGIDEFSSSTRINQYEQGVHSPDFGTTERLAKVLDVPVGYFYTREEQLAVILLLVNKLSVQDRRILVASLRERLEVKLL